MCNRILPLLLLLCHLHLISSSPTLNDRDLASPEDSTGDINGTAVSNTSVNGSVSVIPRFEDLVTARMDALRQRWANIETIAVEGKTLAGPSRSPIAYRDIFIRFFDPEGEAMYSTSTIANSGMPPQWTEPMLIPARRGQPPPLVWDWGSDEMTLAKAFRIVDTYIGEQRPWVAVWKGKFRPLGVRFPNQIYYLFSTSRVRPGNFMVGVSDEQVYQRNGPRNDAENATTTAEEYVQASEWQMVRPPLATVITS